MAKKQSSKANSKRCTCGHLARSHHNGKGGCLKDAECSCKVFTLPKPLLTGSWAQERNRAGVAPGSRYSLKMVPETVYATSPMPLPLRVATKGPLFFRSEEFEAGDALDARSRAERRVADALRILDGSDMGFALRFAAFLVKEVLAEMHVHSSTAAEWKGRK